MAIQSFEGGASGQDPYPVTPSDSVDLPVPARGLIIGTAGTLKITTLRGNIVTFPGIPAGVYTYFGAIRIWATGTTATNIIANP